MLIFGALTRDLVNLNQFCHILVHGASILFHLSCKYQTSEQKRHWQSSSVGWPKMTSICFKYINHQQLASNHPDWQTCCATGHSYHYHPFFSHLLAVLHCSFENQLVDFTLYLKGGRWSMTWWLSDLVLTTLFPLIHDQLSPSGTVRFMATWLLHILDTWRRRYTSWFMWAKSMRRSWSRPIREKNQSCDMIFHLRLSSFQRIFHNLQPMEARIYRHNDFYTLPNWFGWHIKKVPLICIWTSQITPLLKLGKVAKVAIAHSTFKQYTTLCLSLCAYLRNVSLPCAIFKLQHFQLSFFVLFCLQLLCFPKLSPALSLDKNQYKAHVKKQRNISIAIMTWEWSSAAMTGIPSLCFHAMLFPNIKWLFLGQQLRKQKKKHCIKGLCLRARDLPVQHVFHICVFAAAAAAAATADNNQQQSPTTDNNAQATNSNNNK